MSQLSCCLCGGCSYLCLNKVVSGVGAIVSCVSIKLFLVTWGCSSLCVNDVVAGVEPIVKCVSIKLLLGWGCS